MSDINIRSITLRPPPGTRFSIYGADCVLQFQKGRETEVIQWLEHWISAYIKPLALGINPHTQVSEPVDSVIESPVVKVQLETDEDFETFPLALCLSCKQHPIKHLSGLCDKCSASAKATMDAIIGDETNNSVTDNEKENTK
jgi:hypothetical protein